MGSQERELASSSLPPTHGATTVYVRGVRTSVEHDPYTWMDLGPIELRLQLVGSAKAFSSIWGWPSEKYRVHRTCLLGTQTAELFYNSTS